MASLAYAFLLSLLSPWYEPLRCWLLRRSCHRTGRHSRHAHAPFARLRMVLSRLWQHFPPALRSTWLHDTESSSRLHLLKGFRRSALEVLTIASSQWIRLHSPEQGMQQAHLVSHITSGRSEPQLIGVPLSLCSHFPALRAFSNNGLYNGLARFPD